MRYPKHFFVTVSTLILLSAASAGPAGSAPTLFLPYETFPVGSWPEAVAIGDVNSDGRNDVVLTTSFYFDPENDYHIHVFLQNASGGLEPPVKYPAGNGESADIGDLNSDGKNDVAVTADNAIGVFLQNESGGLDPMVTYPTENTLKLRIGDFNNDGLSDAVSMGWSTETVDVFLQNAGGTLDPPITYPVSYGGYNDLEVGDVNDDGLTDVIAMSGQGYAYDNVGVLLQNSEGSLDPAAYYDLGGNELSHGVAVGDINDDALEDVVVTYGGNSPSAFIGTFLQNPSGTLDPAISYQAYDIPEPVEVADVNFDGRNDVIVAHGGWMAMGVFLQDEGGSLLPYERYSLPYASHYNPHGLDIGDINGDGANDVAIADYNNGLVVLYHTPRPAPVPDITANGSDGPITIPHGTNLTLTVTLDPGGYSGENADWWTAAISPFGYYWYTQQGWVKSDTPIRVYGGSLFTLPPYDVLDTTNLPIGAYDFYFGVDLLMNGSLDFDQLYYDLVEVTVE